MVDWFNYTPLAPDLGRYRDDDSEVAFTEDVISPAGEFQVAVIMADQRPSLIRIRTKNSDGNLDPKQIDVVTQLGEHALSIVQTLYGYSFMPLQFATKALSFGLKSTDDNKPSLDVGIETNSHPVDPIMISSQAKHLYHHSLSHRRLLRLFVESDNPNIPIHYRYLSCYKAHEILFRQPDKSWPGLREHLSQFEHDFQDLGVFERSIENTFHELRDKCAHFLRNKFGDYDGINALADQEHLPDMIQILRRSIASKINSIQSGFNISFDKA